jgi:hypothetical protein
MLHADYFLTFVPVTVDQMVTSLAVGSRALQTPIMVADPVMVIFCRRPIGTSTRWILTESY